MSNLEDTTQSFGEDVILRHQLPISKIKKICKLDPLLNSISAEAVLLVTLATEKYAKLLGSAAYSYAKDENRKTIQMKDIDRCIKKDWLFAILEDAINDWPETQPKVYTKTVPPLPKGPSPLPSEDQVFEEELEQDIDRLIDQQSFQRDQLNIQKHNYREKVNDNLLKFSSPSMPKYDQDDIQLLLGGEPGEMMVDLDPDTKDSIQQDQSPDSDNADAFEEEDTQEDIPARGIPDIEDL